MKTFIVFAITLITFQNLLAQNVGIGTSTPAEKLDVNGHIKTSGELKPNGAAGQAGQVLTSNGNGTMQWSSATGSNNNNNNSSIIGYGTWGGCEMNNITDLFPVSDSTGYYNESFGATVAISGDYAIIGNSADDEVGFPDAGSVMIFRRNPASGAWEKQVKFSNPSPASDDQFGASVAINGIYAVVGAPNNDVSGLTDNGAIYVYKRDVSTGTWSFMAMLYDQSAQNGDQFGWSVAIDGDYIAVGAPSDDVGLDRDAGTIAMYKRNAVFDIWEYLQKITDPVVRSLELFGYSVAMSGDELIVGAPYDAELNNGTSAGINGTATMFKRNVSTSLWQTTATFPGAAHGEAYGYAVSISGNNAMIAAPEADAYQCTDCGAVRFLTKNAAGNWVQGFTIINEEITNTNFGGAVSISGDYAIIGNDSSNAYKGQASVYRRMNNVWVLLQKFSNPYPPIGSLNGYFGRGVAIDGVTKRFLVGAPRFYFGMGFFGKVN
ncbi:MAG: hypothetical protein V4722_22735 [Bacteroidota bacterium]